MKRDVLGLVLILFMGLIAQSSTYALPFNDDMVNSDVMTGKIMRPAPEGSIAMGSLDHRVRNREQALKFTNPLKNDKVSAANGKRLFQIHCMPCHGNIESEPYVPGLVAKYLPGPNLAVSLYHDKDGGRTDGAIYATIYFGSLSGLMGPMGFKFSPAEHWDLINYIRVVQEKVK